MAVGRVQVEVFGLHRRRQHHVGEVARVGPALLEHGGEQVVAAQPGVHPVLVGRGGGRVGVEHHQRRDARVGLAGQRRAEPAHVDRPRRRRGHAGRAHHGVLVHPVMTGRHAQRAATGVPEVAGQQRQRADGPDRLPGPAVALQAEPDPDRGRPGGRDPVAEPLHDVDVETALGGGPFHRPIRSAAPRARASRRCARRASPGRPRRRRRRDASVPGPARRRCPAAARCARRTARPCPSEVDRWRPGTPRGPAPR